MIGMNFRIERCEYWNGRDKVCDPERCKYWLVERRERGDDCYHRPFLVNGERKTVIETMDIVFGLTNGE